MICAEIYPDEVSLHGTIRPSELIVTSTRTGSWTPNPNPHGMLGDILGNFATRVLASSRLTWPSAHRSVKSVMVPLALFKNVDPSRLHPIRALQITEFEQSPRTTLKLSLGTGLQKILMPGRPDRRPVPAGNHRIHDARPQFPSVLCRFVRDDNRRRFAKGRAIVRNILVLNRFKCAALLNMPIPSYGATCAVTA